MHYRIVLRDLLDPSQQESRDDYLDILARLYHGIYNAAITPENTPSDERYMFIDFRQKLHAQRFTFRVLQKQFMVVCVARRPGSLQRLSGVTHMTSN
eukprot:56799-Eustigmatos_ZCMA.PRE.1